MHGRQLTLIVRYFRQNLIRFYCTIEKSNDGLEVASPSYEIWKPVDDTGKYHGFIPLKKLEISYSTSSGPGGQNVNKCHTRAEVRFHVDNCDWIPASVRQKFLEQHNHRITKDGYFVIRSERTRSQSLNLTDCLEKLRCSIRECERQLQAKTPVQLTDEELETMRRKQESAERRRIEQKRRASEWKKQKRVDDFD